MKPDFSIIIPTLNEEKYLVRLIRNLLRQKFKNFEVIIIDGNSDDDTCKVAMDFRKNLTVRVFKTTKRQVSFQRNWGAKKAKGDFLVFLDADAGVSPTFLDKLAKYISRKKGLVFIPNFVPDEKTPDMMVAFRLANIFVEASQNTPKPFSSGGSMIFEKHFFQQLGGFDEKLFMAEDHDIIRRAAEWGVKAKFLRNIKLEFSLRRFRREGKLKMIYRYLLASYHFIVKGKIDRKIFDYEMGGHLYPKRKTDLQSPEENIKLYFEQLKSLFNRVF